MLVFYLTLLIGSVSCVLQSAYFEGLASNIHICGCYTDMHGLVMPIFA